MQTRHDWTEAEIAAYYRLPLLDLVFEAAMVHRHCHDPHEIELCLLQSIKTGGCPEDCAYCAQSSFNSSEVDSEPILALYDIVAMAEKARSCGATRFCMGAAWRRVKNDAQFDLILSIVKAVSELGIETCCSLGSLDFEQAVALKKAGLSTYNHNLDTSRKYYTTIVTTRCYDERLATIEAVQAAGIGLCCGGIIGMGEDDHDRIDFLHSLATMAKHPDSIPLNILVPIKGTPLADRPLAHCFEIVRMIAVARILIPEGSIRLSAGRAMLSQEGQAMAFLAGANSIFIGERLLTTTNTSPGDDRKLLDLLSLKGRNAHAEINLLESRG